jgi:hypothetical protein
VGKIHSWPLSNDSIEDFIVFAIREKKLKHSTIKSYISSFALYQNLKNLDSSNCYSFQTKMLLKGAKNLEFYNEIIKPSRKAISYPLLKLLNHQIAETKWSQLNKQVFWTALSVAFFGSMRFGELLSSHRESFIPEETLLWEDVKFTEDSVVITIKIPKTRNLKGEYIDLFEVPDGRYCPLKALKVLKDLSGPSCEKIPVFKFDNGSYLTIENLNTTLHTLLFPLLGSTAYQFSGHSFRAGLPSALANCPDLADDKQIQSWGRWSSQCFKLYTRLRYQQKKHIFYKMLKAIERQ